MFETLQLNEPHDKQEYISLLSSLQNKNPYYLIDFIDVFGGGLNNLFCFKYSTNNSIIIMPGFLRNVVIGEVITPYFDFISPYGYSGPYYTSSSNEEDLNKFWINVDKWYKKNNVVSEFIRFSLHNNYLNYSGDLFPTMLNVKGEIIEADNQWKSFDRKVRKNVNKASRENLTYTIYYKEIDDKYIEEFHEIYIDTMIRTNASESFMYSIYNFKKFIKNNVDTCAICTVYDQGISISSELVLISEDSIFSFLGGTNESYFDKRPNNFLKFQLINWAREINKKYFVLGGGYGFEDGIFKYKKAFFPNDIVTYYTGRKIINEEIYRNLIKLASDYRVSNGKEPLLLSDNTFFPLYNKK